ncbi:hypothetical protein ACWPXT_12690 [Enterococcus faecium]
MNKFVHPLITKEEFTHYILEPFFEANFWSMNHITPTEQAYLYFMFGVMNTYWKKICWILQIKYKKVGAGLNRLL